MIDIRADIEKLQYSQSVLTQGEAANKIKILAIEGSNYLKRFANAYEVNES